MLQISSMRRKFLSGRIVIVFLIIVLIIVTTLCCFKIYENNELQSFRLTTEDSVFQNGKSRVIKVYDAKIEPPGVIVNVKEGIGNQLFLYACAYALAKELHWPLYICIHRSRLRPNRMYQPYDREFALDNFHIPLDNLFFLFKKSQPEGPIRFISDEELLLKRLNRSNLSEFLQLDVNSYCLSKEYWNDYENDIVKMFRVTVNEHNISDNIQRIWKYIKESESVAVHVRRGDHMNRRYYIPMSYYRRAIKKMANILKKRNKSPVFFIFSDEIQTVIEELADLKDLYDIVFVNEAGENTTSLQDFKFMTDCKHMIFAHSTFGWWAAFLIENPNKVVIASTFNPEFFETKLWTDKQISFYRYSYANLYYPKSWIVINTFNVSVY